MNFKYGRTVAAAAAGLAMAAGPARGLPASAAHSSAGRHPAARLQVPFVENRGQLDEARALFYARTFGGLVAVMDDGALVYALPGREPGAAARLRTALLREVFEGARVQAAPEGADRATAVISSFTGRDPARWRTGLPAFNRVRLGEIYDGIVLDVRAYGDNVEKLFTVAPGADPGRIAMRYEGAAGVSVTREGELELATGLGPVRFTAPVAYQEGPAGRRTVPVSYAVRNGRVGFDVGAYDAAAPLVIDPLLASTFIGGSSADAIRAVAVDGQSNVLVAGETASADFPTTNSPAQASYAGGLGDAFVAKFDASLSTLLAATYLGGAGEDAAAALAVNPANGAVCVGGHTVSSDFPTRSAAYPIYRGNGDGFVAVLNGNLTALSMSTFLGGWQADRVNALALNAAGEIVVVGRTESADFPHGNPWGASFQAALGGGADGFATLFAGAGIASTFLGGSGDDEALGVAVAGDGSICVAGATASANFPGVNGYQASLSGSSDGVVAVLAGNLTAASAVSYLGGSGADAAQAVAVVPGTNLVCVAGWTESADYPRNPTNEIAPGHPNAHRGGRDAFLTRLDLALTNLAASSYLGGSGQDEATAVLVGLPTNALNVYVAGHTDSADFPVTANALDTGANGGRDGFVSCWSTAPVLQASTYLGGSGDDEVRALAISADRFSLFAAGLTLSTNFPSTRRAYDPDRSGRTDADGFVARLGSGLAYGSRKWQVSLQDPDSDLHALYISPTLAWDGTVLVGAGSYLYAYNPDGRLKWRFKANGRLHDITGGYFGGLGAVAVGRDETIYFGTMNGILHAVDKSGNGLWTLNQLSGRIYSSPAIGADGTVYYGHAESPFKLCAVSSNGNLNWSVNLPSSILGSPAVDASGRVFAACSSVSTPRLFMYDTNGAALTNWTISYPVAASPVIGRDNWVYIGAGTNLYGFSTTGTQSRVWSFAKQIHSSPAVDANGILYVAVETNLYACNPAGGILRSWRLSGPSRSSPFLAEDGTIYVNGSNAVHAFHPSGATNWTFALDPEDESIYQSPMVASDGTVYTAGLNFFYALCGRSGPLSSPWTGYKHDALRTGNAGFDPAVILKPTGLTASQGAFPDRVQVDWNPTLYADYYEVFRNTNNNPAAAALLATVLEPGLEDTTVEPGRIYYYWVRVTTPVTTSVLSDPAAGGAPPLPPAGVEATKGNPTNAVVVTWNPSQHATDYRVFRSLINAPDGSDYLTNTAETVWTNTDIARGLGYYYWVQAANGLAGTSTYSAGDGVLNRGGTPPLPPAALEATTNDYRAVFLTWDASIGAAQYAVYRSPSNVWPTAFLGVTNTLAYADETAEAFRDYYFWVRGTNEFGLGEYSAPVIGKRLLAPPAWIDATKGVYPHKVRVSWAPVSAATRYRIFRNGTPDPATASNLIELVAPATNYDDLAITRGLGYYYWVQSRNEYGVSLFSSNALGGTVPYPPLSVEATDGTTGFDPVIVTWAGAAHAGGYQIFRREEYEPWALTAPWDASAGTIYLDARSRPGQRYYYWVKSTNAFGGSELSGFDIGWRELSAPLELTASDGASVEHLLVSWTVSDNASTYELWRGLTNSLASARLLANAVTTNYYRDFEAGHGVLYYYWVKAKTAQFVSDFSPPDSGYRALDRVDLGISDCVFLPTRLAALRSPEAVSFRIANYGRRPMAEPNARVVCNFYLSANPVFGDADDQWMGGVPMSLPLAVGESRVVVLPKALRETLAMPEDLQVGRRYTVFAAIQHQAPSKWLDPNPANNAVARNGGTVEGAAFQPLGLALINDFNGDGFTDEAMYQEATGTWQVWLFGGQRYVLAGCGGPGHGVAAADYDGDGKTDPAVYQESTGTWQVRLSASGYGPATAGGWGGPGWQPVRGDYDGDGKADAVVYEEATGRWRGWLSGTGYGLASHGGAGGPGWQPVPGDFDGDGKADLVVYEQATGAWRMWRSDTAYVLFELAGMGGPGFVPVAADYDGDGLADPAVYQPETGAWRAWLSERNYEEASAEGWGGPGRAAVPGDYDGDGLADPAIYWESFGLWRLWLSSLGYQAADLLAWPGDSYRPAWR